MTKDVRVRGKGFRVSIYRYGGVWAADIMFADRSLYLCDPSRRELLRRAKRLTVQAVREWEAGEAFVRRLARRQERRNKDGK